MIRSVLTAGFLVAALASGQAYAWYHATAYGHTSGGDGSWSHSGEYGTASGGDGSWNASGYRGGSASGGDGSWSGTGYRGGSASGGDGSWSGTGYRGGTASGGEGSWQATGAEGNTVSGYHYGGYGTTYYHPPTSVYSGSGCYDCGGISPAGAAVAGAVVGAGVANQNAYYSTAGNAYGAGYQAGLAAAAPTPALAMGAMFATLPPGCSLRTVSGGTYYQCGNAWVQPNYGANGVFYTVVPEPY